MLHCTVWYMVIDLSEQPTACVFVALRIESVRSGFKQGQEFFIFLQNFQTGTGAYRAPYWVGTWGLSYGINRPGPMTGHWLPYSGGVQNGWSYKFLAYMRTTLPTTFYHNYVDFYHTTRRHIPENGNPQLQPCEHPNLPQFSVKLIPVS